MDSACVKTPENFILFDNVILHVLILFTILSVLFIFVIEKLSTYEINKQFITMIDTFVNPENIKELILNRTSPETLKKLIATQFNIDITNSEQVVLLESIYNFISSMVESDIAGLKIFLTNIINDYNTNEHALRKANNDKVHQQIFMTIVFFVILAFIVYILSQYSGKYCGFMKHLSFELLVIFACIGGIEYWFFTNVASKYVPVKPTVIISTFKESLLNKLKN